MDWLGEIRLADNSFVRFRHVRPADEALIAAAINSASRETLLHRFFSPIRQIAPDQLQRMLVIDPHQETCLVGLTELNSIQRIVCGARYVKLSTPDRAEIAITVHDAFQHHGLGTFLLRLLARLAGAEGIIQFEAEVLSSNNKMHNLLRKLARGQARVQWTGDVYHWEIPVQVLAETKN